MKKIFKAGLPILVTTILNYIIIIITGIIYYLLGNHDVDTFINNISPYILITYYILVILYLYKKNYHKEPKLHHYFSQIYLGLSLATFLNMIIFKIIPNTSIHILSNSITFISSTIIGPIYEEILFRYIFYNRLKKDFPIKKAIFITSIIFALIHFQPIKIIYAFIIGFILNIIYERDKNIISPIFIHIAANTIVLFLNEYNTYILLLSLINLFLSIKLISNKKSSVKKSK